MIAEKNGEHGESGHQVAADDGPRRQRVEEPRPEDHDHGQHEDLEAAEEHENREEDAAIAIDEGEQPGRAETEEDEGQPVRRRVLEDETRGDGEGAGIAEPMKQRSREQGRSAEWRALGEIVEEEPDRDGGRAGQAHHHSFNEHALSSHDHALARLVSLCRPGRMALKKAFWIRRMMTSEGFTLGLSRRPEISAFVATSSRGRFLRSLATPPTTRSYTLCVKVLSWSFAGS